MIYYKSVKDLMHASGFTEVIIKTIVKHYDLLNSIVSNQEPIFKSKFWLSLYYFLGI